MSDQDTFEKMGNSYQEKVVTAIMTDPMFAEQISDVMRPKFFNLEYLREIVSKVYDHKEKYKTFPSIDLVSIMLKGDDELDSIVRNQAQEYLLRAAAEPLNGDASFVCDNALDFCRRQTMKEAMIKCIDRMEESKYDEIATIVKDALNKGASRDLGHDYMNGFEKRCQKSIRDPLPTPWKVLDMEFNGGWERSILATFIAPTGAGKSMFLCNVGAAAIENGFNVLYVTCEMADYKIALRFDSYYSGVPINDIPHHAERVEKEVRSKVKGRLLIKEYPTKTATVQTLRSYIQRVIATKDFKPDFVIVDYADLLRSSRGYGEKRHELEGVYEDLRAVAQEFKVVVVTADQTNRSGLNDEVVTLSSIAESYAKATVCDVIITISRRMEDKQSNSGRIFIAKSRLGRDGIVYPFLMNPATVRVNVLNQNEDPMAHLVDGNKQLAERAQKLMTGKLKASAE